jgi:hypothetical protein
LAYWCRGLEFTVPLILVLWVGAVLVWACFVISQALASYEAALILETSTDTRITATDTMNANVAATAPIDRNGAFSMSEKPF